MRQANQGDGSMLRKLRQRHGLSQRTLSEKSKISRGRLRRLETGNLEGATFAELKELAQALGIEVDDFFPERGEPVSRLKVCRAGKYAYELTGTREGYRLLSFFSQKEETFIGKLFVSGKNVFPPAARHHLCPVFLQVLLGTVLVRKGRESCELREGDSVLFRGKGLWSLESSRQREAVVLFVASASST